MRKSAIPVPNAARQKERERMRRERSDCTLRDAHTQVLRTYEANLHERVTQVDRGVFKWGALIGKKPGN